MNDKETKLHAILDIVVDCCSIEVDSDGTRNITREQILGSSRADNAVMTRCLFAVHVKYAGFSVTTIAQLLHKTEPAVRNMFKQHCHYLIDSKAYRTADAEVTLKCKDL